jgi:hypothetical protein
MFGLPSVSFGQAPSATTTPVFATDRIRQSDLYRNPIFGAVSEWLKRVHFIVFF